MPESNEQSVVLQVVFRSMSVIVVRKKEKTVAVASQVHSKRGDFGLAPH